MKMSISFFESVRLWNGRSDRSSSVVDSWSERSTSSLKITRPGVVRISSSPRRYSIGCWIPTWPSSTASSTPSSFAKRFGRGSSSSDVVAARSISEYVM